MIDEFNIGDIVCSLVDNLGSPELIRGNLYTIEEISYDNVLVRPIEDINKRLYIAYWEQEKFKLSNYICNKCKNICKSNIKECNLMEEI